MRLEWGGGATRNWLVGAFVFHLKKENIARSLKTLGFYLSF